MEKTKTNNSESKNEEYVTLNSGYKMPLCGLGTYAGENLDKLIYDSIKSGIRLIDTARYYENEEAIGKGIKKALDDKIVERKDLFIITKIWSTDYGKIEETIKTQLKDLQVDYVDLYLAHWPINIIYSEKDGKKDVTFYSWHKLWPQFESLVDNGYAKSIGISNFNVQLISDILSYARIKPAVNEFELNPYLPQIGLVDFCNKYDIKIIAYNSLVLGMKILSKSNNYQFLNLLKLQSNFLIDLNLNLQIPMI